ncbi:MAG: hypothetical protein AAGE05_15485 [Pseudomonadota bacterium]
MEKTVYALWKPDAALLSALPEKLSAAGATGVRINLRDEDVAPADALTQSRGEAPPDAAVQLWLPSANPIFRSEIDHCVSARCARFAAWLVSESVIITNEDHSPAPGERTYGFAQMAFLTRPDGLDWKDWRTIWRDSHTKVAIETQSNFEYVQNLVVEPLTDDAPPCVAIVEECFPPEAMTDPLAFFDAVGDQAKFDRNLAAMMESCDRFIERGAIDVIPTSQYDFG